MITLRAKIEEDRKKKGAVIGRVISGPDSGKIVFFNGKNKPLIDDVVFLDKVDDKGRFLVAKKWKISMEEKIKEFFKDNDQIFRFAQAASGRDAVFAWRKIYEKFGKKGVLKVFELLESFVDPDFVITRVDGSNSYYIEEFRHEFDEGDMFLKTEKSVLSEVRQTLTMAEKERIFSCLLASEKIRQETIGYLSCNLNFTFSREVQQKIINGIFLERKRFEKGNFHFDSDLDVSAHLRKDYEEEEQDKKNRTRTTAKNFFIEPFHYGPITECLCGNTPRVYFTDVRESRNGQYLGRLVVECPFCDNNVVNMDREMFINKEMLNEHGPTRLILQCETIRYLTGVIK